MWVRNAADLLMLRLSLGVAGFMKSKVTPGSGVLRLMGCRELHYRIGFDRTFAEGFAGRRAVCFASRKVYLAASLSL